MSEGVKFWNTRALVQINFFDTAGVYSKGSSEEILGRALKDFAAYPSTNAHE